MNFWNIVYQYIDSLALLAKKSKRKKNTQLARQLFIFSATIKNLYTSSVTSSTEAVIPFRPRRRVQVRDWPVTSGARQSGQVEILTESRTGGELSFGVGRRVFCLRRPAHRWLAPGRGRPAQPRRRPSTALPLPRFSDANEFRRCVLRGWILVSRDPDLRHRPDPVRVPCCRLGLRLRERWCGRAALGPRRHGAGESVRLRTRAGEDGHE